jgi:hypothetical protein
MELLATINVASPMGVPRSLQMFIGDKQYVDDMEVRPIFYSASNGWGGTGFPIPVDVLIFQPQAFLMEYEEPKNVAHYILERINGELVNYDIREVSLKTQPKATLEEKNLCIEWFKERGEVATMDDAENVFIECEIDGTNDTLVLHDTEIRFRAEQQTKK